MPGVEIGESEILIPDGSRYPFDVHRYRFDNIGKRRIALLGATDQLRYVDSKMLHMSQMEFEEMVSELVQAGFLRKNGSGNPFGANSYNTTIKYQEECSPRKAQGKAIEIIASAVAAAAVQLAAGVV